MAPVAVDHFLNYLIVFFVIGNFTYRLVGLFKHLLQFFIPPAIEVFLILTLLTLQISVQLRTFFLPRHPLRLGERRGVAVKLFAKGLQGLLQVRQFLATL